jgi:hypothetical protein
VRKVERQTAFPRNYYSISTAKGVNLPKLNVLILSVLIISSTSSSAVAELYVEDFEYEKPGRNDFTNGVFQHNILPIPPLNLPVWDISNFGSPPADSNALDLWPAIDEITFDLGPGEYIDYVSLDVISWAADTTVEVYHDVYFNNGSSTQGELEIQCMPDHGWNSEDTGFLRDIYLDCDRIEIYKVILSSSEGGFDNLTINVVPEPATLLLFGLGAAFLRKRR